MIKKFTTTFLTLFFLAVAAIPVSAQMSDDEVLRYAKEAMSSGKSTETIVAELAAKGVSVEQAKRVQATINGSTGTAAF